MSQAAVKERKPASPARAGYDDDLYSWALEQARLVREGVDLGLDRENVAEELESLAKREASKLESALVVLLMHMLKWDYQPERVSRSWENSIATQRERYHRVLRDNPGLKSKVATTVADAYMEAARWASSQTGIPRDEFPETCPYTMDDILGRAFEYQPPARD